MSQLIQRTEDPLHRLVSKIYNDSWVWVTEYMITQWLECTDDGTVLNSILGELDPSHYQKHDSDATNDEIERSRAWYAQNMPNVLEGWDMYPLILVKSRKFDRLFMRCNNDYGRNIRRYFEQVEELAITAIARVQARNVELENRAKFNTFTGYIYIAATLQEARAGSFKFGITDDLKARFSTWNTSHSAANMTFHCTINHVTIHHTSSEV